MTTTSRLIILTGFLAGSAFGYFDFFRGLTQDLRSEAAQSSSQKGGRSSGLKLVHDSRQGNIPSPTEDNIQTLLLRYANFSPREIREELIRLLKDVKQNKRSNSGLDKAITYLAYKLGFQSPEEAKQLLADGTFQDFKEYFSPVLQGWSQKDFQGAMDYLLAHKKDFKFSVDAFTLLTQQFVKKDPDRAIQWISTLTPGERTSALHAMAREFPLSHPEKMSDYVALLTNTDLRSFPIRELASAWAETDWESAYAWANTLNTLRKEEAISQVIASLSKANLPKATEELKKADRKYKDHIASSIIGEAFDRKEQASGKSLDWVLENKDIFPKPEWAIRSCLGIYEIQTPEVTKKVLRMPEGKLKDEALGMMVQMRTNLVSSAFNDEENILQSQKPFLELLDLASKISDSNKQHTAVENCVRTWLQNSPEEARQWITDKSQLPNHNKQQLLKDCDFRQKEKTARNS